MVFKSYNNCGILRLLLEDLSTNSNLDYRRINMLSVNNGLFDTRNIYNFVDASINILVNSIPTLTTTKEYWLFYYIKDDFFANWKSLYNANIDQDFLGFPLIKKNTRHAIESFLDLYNLCKDEEYIIVLEYCAKKNNNAGKYSSHLFNGQFSIQSKCNIAKTYGGDFQYLLNISRDSNDYVHPNVFVDVILLNERDKKEEILTNLLNINFYLLVSSYELILNKYNNNNQPFLGCCMNNICYQCYRNAQNAFKYCIDNQLLIDINPIPVAFR
jgi:hypothetical protein